MAGQPAEVQVAEAPSHDEMEQREKDAIAEAERLERELAELEGAIDAAGGSGGGGES